MRSTTAKFLFVEDVMQILGISQSKAYQIMRKINRELEAEGYRDHRRESTPPPVLREILLRR